MTHSEKWETAKRVFAKMNPDEVSQVFRGFYVPTTPQKDGEEDAKEKEVKGNMEYPSEEELEALIEEADRLIEENPHAQWNQPPGGWVDEAEGLLPDGAPWHHVVVVAYALEEKDERLYEEQAAQRKAAQRKDSHEKSTN